MTKHSFRPAVWATSLLAFAVSSYADVKVNDVFSVNGYAVGSYSATDVKDGDTISSYFDNKGGPAIPNADAVKFGILAAKGSWSAYGSLLYLPGAANDAGMLDAYVTYDTGMGLKITGGKFLSYLGYEAFDPINMAQLTYGYTIFAVPAYHTGAKFDYATKTFSIGVSVVDSIYSGKNGFFEGDREYSDDIGFEVAATYTGIDKLTIFAAIASENTYKADNSLFIFDLWASYNLTDKVTIAAEYDTQNDYMNGWLTFLSYKFSDKFSTAFRISGVSWNAGGSDTKYTIAPTYTINNNLFLRAEYSLGQGDVQGDYNYIGAQIGFKF
jgi:Putative beta-barrel porin-2, OmpL-like. bbp2